MCFEIIVFLKHQIMKFLQLINFIVSGWDLIPLCSYIFDLFA